MIRCTACRPREVTVAVRDAETHRPVPGAVVRVSNPDTGEVPTTATVDSEIVVHWEAADGTAFDQSVTVLDADATPAFVRDLVAATARRTGGTWPRTPRPGWRSGRTARSPEENCPPSPSSLT